MAADFADRYHNAFQNLPHATMQEVVSRNSFEEAEGIYRPDNEPDEEFVRRIIATYLAVTSTEGK